jgi:hypothetical protein
MHTSFAPEAQRTGRALEGASQRRKQVAVCCWTRLRTYRADAAAGRRCNKAER